jgi:hypothetical protein
VSLSFEFGFPQRQFDENSVTLEVRPIIEKKFGRFQIDINPLLGRALYYSDLGPIKDLPPVGKQAHQFYPGGDLKFGDNPLVNFGVGVGATNVGNRLIYEIRIGHLF